MGTTAHFLSVSENHGLYCISFSLSIHGVWYILTEIQWSQNGLHKTLWTLVAAFFAILNVFFNEFPAYNFWITQSVIALTFFPKATTIRCCLLFYTPFLIVDSATPRITHLAGRNLRILPLEGKLRSNRDN